MRAPSYWQASLRIFELSLGEMLWSRRTIFMALVVGSPVLLAGVIRAIEAAGIAGFRVESLRINGATIFGMLIWVLYLRFIVPVLGIFYGTALIADEIEDKTITYLFTRPIPRGAVLVGKYLAYLTCTILVVLPSVMLVYFLLVPIGSASLVGSFPSLVTDLGLLALGLAVYGSLFGFVGARLKRPVVFGLVFAFGWEQAALIFPGYLRRFTVAYYLQALVPHAMPEQSTLGAVQALFRDAPSGLVSLAWLALFWLGFLFLAARTVERREYVLEQ
ncbi:MAG: ABC transporter permease [Acidobacteria bacterium]|nr:ABC transporter permease [Acidobacteriota bacterium]